MASTPEARRVAAPDGSPIGPGDIDVLRRLAARKVEIAHHPVNEERRRAWYAHDAGSSGRPMVLAETGGLRDAVLPVPASDLECAHDWARQLERALRVEIYQFEELGDDHVVEPSISTNWCVEADDYGVEVVQHHPDFEGFGARRWDAPIRDLQRDFHKLRPRSWRVDREATHADQERLEQLFGDFLTVRVRGRFWWTMGMTWTAIELIGLENLMVSMYDDPEGLHQVMAFLRDDHLAFAEWLEAEGLFSLDNENDYIGSGSMGYTRDLPGADRPEGGPVQTHDQWVLLESQETVGVGPEQFEEFVFPYQLRLAERFGKCYYGCCEPVHSRIHILKRLPNLARMSVSPWADEEIMARELGRDIVYSRKPNPTLVSTDSFDEEAIRADLRRTLEVADGCRVEFVMKDVHTVANEPQRLPRWVQLARETIDEMAT